MKRPKRRKPPPWCVVYVNDDVDARQEIDRETFMEIINAVQVKPVFLDYRGERYLVNPLDPQRTQAQRRIRAIHVSKLDEVSPDEV